MPFPAGGNIGRLYDETVITSSGYFGIDGDKLYYERAGGSPTTIVLLHEGVANLRMWDDQAPAFAEKYSVLRYDFRNYGKSSSASSEFSGHEDLRAILDHLGIDRAVLLGASMGGGIALDFALTYPERTIALIPVAAGLNGFESPNDPALEERWKKLLAAYNSGDKELATEICCQTWFDGPKRKPGDTDVGIRARARMMMHDVVQRPDPGKEIEPTPLEPTTATRLGEISAPTLVIFADGDQLAIADASVEIAAKVPGAKLEVMHGPGHLPNMELPDEFNRLVLDFLASVA